MAERVGFEPTVPVKVRQFSRLLDSSTLAPLRSESLMIMVIRIRFQVGEAQFQIPDFRFQIRFQIPDQISDPRFEISESEIRNPPGRFWGGLWIADCRAPIYKSFCEMKSSLSRLPVRLIVRVEGEKVKRFPSTNIMYVWPVSSPSKR